jgi:serine/threonine-protein kinase
MGAVYRTWDTRLNRPVALKEMIPQSGLDVSMLGQLRQQFQQEAQVLATLVHPNLVRVTDYFSWGGNEYLAMDFIEGESLAERIHRDGIQPEGQVVAWTGQLLDALAYCHERGVIHRDIKPQNIIVTPEGRAVLVDFGLVKLWDPRDPRTRTVMRGAGTPEYAPPEQYDMGLGHTDPRSDVYSLGATLYHALSGQVPPTATQRMATPTSFVPLRRINTAVSSATEAVVLKALEMAMEQRFQSADEMAQALGFVQRTSLVTPHRVPSETQRTVPATEVQAPAKRKRGTWLGLGGVGLAVVGVLCLALAIGAALIGLFVARGCAAPLPTTPPSLPATITPLPPATTTPLPPATGTPLPLATVTPLPTNTSVPETGNTLFQDDFESSASGWEIGNYEGGSVGYKSGVYFVIARKSGSTMWGVANRSFDNLVIEVDVTQVAAGSENNNDYGLICREQGNGDGYYMLVSGDGFYAILTAKEAKFEPLADWKKSDVIRQGNATNHIRAVCDSTTLELFVNGQRLATAEDSTYTKGDIAFTATSYEENPTQIHFDNLIVRTP